MAITAVLGACGPGSRGEEGKAAGEIAYSAGYGLDSSVQVVRTDGSGSREVARPTMGGPAWSPDGAQLAFFMCEEGAPRCTIWVRDVDGEREVWRTDNAMDPAWSPDGTEIAFIRCGDTEEGRCAIFAVPTKVEGARPRRVTEDGLYGPHVVWSPDGKRLAFEQMTLAFGGIVVVVADGSGVVWSTQHFDSDPSWSPDGGQIAFVRKTHVPGGGDLRGDVYVIAADGTGARRITDGKTSAESPAWSPAGDRIVFTQRAGDDGVECPSSALFAAAPDGSKPRRLTPYGALNAEPAWSPDGRQIAFARMDECGSEEGPILSLVAAEGGDARPISPVARLDSSPVRRPPYGVLFAWRPSP